jgi:hypothetical protein
MKDSLGHGKEFSGSEKGSEIISFSRLALFNGISFLLGLPRGFF